MVNEAISAPRILLIDAKNAVLGEMSREQAFFIAQDEGYDLIQVGQKSPTVAVVKMLDFDKERYEQEKQAKKQRAKKVRTGETKEIKLSFSIEKHDLETKARKTKKFLNKGYMIRLFMRLKGRENDFAQAAQEKFKQFATILEIPLEKIEKKGNTITALLIKKN